MSDEAQRDDLAKKQVVYQIPAMEDVHVKRNIEYRAATPDAMTMDIYYPPKLRSGELSPVTIFIFGYIAPMFGKMLKDTDAYVSWGKLLAASGIAAVTYTYQNPVTDLSAVIKHIKQNAAALGIDEHRMSVWSCSGNVPMALSALMHEAHDTFKCAVLCYGYMLDLHLNAHVAEAAVEFGFADPAAGQSIDDMPPQLPLFVLRAGQDQIPHVNETIDLFISKALAHNLPMSFVNYATAPHAFDLFVESDNSREIIKRIIGFLQFNLRV